MSFPHHATCHARYPEKPANEVPQHLIVDFECDPGFVTLTCADCGATMRLGVPAPDAIVEANVAILRSRSRVGLQKYGVNLERKDLDLVAWLNHLHEELLDAANYTLRSMHELHETGNRFEQACERILDMLHGDDGQAWSEAERFLKAHAPHLYDQIGMKDEKRDV